MTTLYKHASLEKSAGSTSGSYTGYKEPDTKVPPKANPVMNEISVNCIRIPESEILAEAQHHPAETPGEAVLRAAEALVVRQLLLQRGRRLELSPQPRIDDEGSAETDEDALIRQVVENEVVAPVAGDKECLRFYKNNKQKFCSDTIYEASHILLAGDLTKAEDRLAAKDKAKYLHVQLLETPADFKEIAKEFSSCPSKEQGGNLGQLTTGSTVKEFEQAIEKMEGLGLLPEPVESRFGFHIIRLDRKIPGNVVPFEHVQDLIASWLEASSWSKAVSQYIHILAGDADIEGLSLSNVTSPLVQ